MFTPIYSITLGLFPFSFIHYVGPFIRLDTLCIYNSSIVVFVYLTWVSIVT